MLHLTWFKVNICDVLAFKCRFCLSNSSLLELAVYEILSHLTYTIFTNTHSCPHTHNHNTQTFSFQCKIGIIFTFSWWPWRFEINNPIRNLEILRPLSWIQVDSMLVTCLKLVDRITQTSVVVFFFWISNYIVLYLC